MNVFEQLKDITGYEGLYQVSSYGNIYSLISNKYLKATLNNTGYYHVILYKDNNKKQFTVHRLVALHFIPNPNNKPQVNHKDGDKLNNNVSNLEWVTNKENQQHAWAIGLNENTRKQAPITAKKYCSKKVYYPELDKNFNSIREASRKLSIDNSSISRCCREKRKFAGKHPDNKDIKLSWRYI